MEDDDDDGPVRKTTKWLERVSKGVCPELEVITLEAIRILEARSGYLRCNLVVPIGASDEDGNWHTGAIVTLIDCIAALAVHSFDGKPMASVDLCVSFQSTAKIQEEVEIEAKVVGDINGKLSSVVVEVIKRKDDERQLIASGNLWIISKI